MKIVYDHQAFNLQKYGGVPRYFYEISNRIADFDNCEVRILAGLYINEYLKNCPPNLVKGWKRPALPKTTKVVNFVNTLAAKYWVNSNIPDVIHETYYSINSIAASSSKTKTVITVYDMIQEKFVSIFPEAYKAFSSIKFKAIQRADKVICISHNTKKDLIDIFDIDPEKITVVYLASSLNSEISLDKKSHSPDFHPYIFYVGERWGYKNFIRLVQAYASNPNLHSNFNLICMGSSKFSQDELNLIHSLGLGENKVLHVKGDDRDLGKLYSQASAFIYPSLYEGFGIPLLEAMSFGCPVVCSNTSSFPEVAGNAAEFFDPYDIDRIAGALENVLFRSDLTEQLIKLGYERVKKFSWEECAKQTYSTYISTLL